MTKICLVNSLEDLTRACAEQIETNKIAYKTATGVYVLPTMIDTIKDVIDREVTSPELRRGYVLSAARHNYLLSEYDVRGDSVDEVFYKLLISVIVAAIRRNRPDLDEYKQDRTRQLS